MATEQKIKELSTVIATLSQIDRDKLIRKGLGEESLEKEIQPILDDLNKRAEFALKYASHVHDSYIETIKNSFQQISQQLTTQANRNNQEYIANKTTFLNGIFAQLEQIKAHWSHFVTAAIEERGFLQDEGVRREYEKAISRMQSEADDTLGHIRQESKAAIEEARKLAEQIESKARRTAQKISVQAAQDQFKEAQRPLAWQIGVWAVLSALSLIGFALLINSFLSTKLPDDWDWQIIYYTTIRLTALAAVGSVAAYCMRILKAQLHMFQHNLHRQRVTNCIEAFVESAVMPEQRDLILAHLVDAVASFGNSGLLQVEGGVGEPGSKLTIDNITRAIPTSPRESPIK